MARSPLASAPILTLSLVSNLQAAQKCQLQAFNAGSHPARREKQKRHALVRPIWSHDPQQGLEGQAADGSLRGGGVATRKRGDEIELPYKLTQARLLHTQLWCSRVVRAELAVLKSCAAYSF